MAGRPRKQIERVELRLPVALHTTLQAEAQSRGVSLQRHIEDLLSARDLLLTGRITFGGQPSTLPTAPADDAPDPMVDQWM